MGFCQLQYLARTAPRQFLGPLLEWYDKRYRQAFETIIERTLPEQSWRQANLPPKLGGLGLVLESIPIGDCTCYRADISYLVASRFVQDLRPSLVPSIPHHSILGWTVVPQRLQALFTTWQADFQNSQLRLRQKDLVSRAEAATGVFRDCCLPGINCAFNVIRDVGLMAGFVVPQVTLSTIVLPTLHFQIQ